jgi:hypothetical protein
MCEVERRKHIKSEGGRRDEAVRWSGGVDGDGAGQAGATLCGALSSPSPCVVVRRRAENGGLSGAAAKTVVNRGGVGGEIHNRKKSGEGWVT